MMAWWPTAGTGILRQLSLFRKTLQDGKGDPGGVVWYMSPNQHKHLDCFWLEMSNTFGVEENRKGREKSGSKWQGVYCTIWSCWCCWKNPSCLSQHSLKSVTPTTACLWERVLLVSRFGWNLVGGAEFLLNHRYELAWWFTDWANLEEIMVERCGG